MAPGPPHRITVISRISGMKKTPNTNVAQLAERRSLTGELTLFYARPVADG